jgi:protein SCO1/2
MASVLLALLCGNFLAAMALAQPGYPSPALPVNIGIDQKLDQQVPLDLDFRDEAGKTVRLGDYFGRKPVILSLVYYDCPMLCTLSLNGLLTSLQHLTFSAGDEFNVVTVSFDPREKPELAAAKKRVYLTLYNRPTGWNGWHFLTGDQESIRRLTDAVGFKYKWDDASGQYSHATGIMVLTPQGRIARYFYGISYPATDLRLGLIEASANKIGTPVDAVLLLCSHYDPVQGRYGLIVTRVLQLAGAATVLILGSFIGFWFLRDRRSSTGVAMRS